MDESNGLSLLRDPTIFAYAHLKDKQGGPLKLRPFQDLLINDRSQFVLGACARQVGKTWTGAVKIIHHALNVNNGTVLLTSKTIEQARNVMREIKEMCLRSDIELADDEDSKSVFSIRNNDGKGVAKVIVVSPTETARGYSPTLAFPDELGYMENGENFYEHVLEPSVSDTQHWEHQFLTMGQIFGVSNPNGKQGIMWKLWDTDARFSRYRFDWMAHPKNTKEMFLLKKDTVPPDVFDSEYAAVFSSASGRFITQEMYEGALDRYQLVLPDDVPVFFGFDVAGEDVKSRNTDRTVMFGFIVLREVDEGVPKLTPKMVYYKCWPPRTQRKLVYQEILRVFRACNFCGISYDKMGGGDTVFHSLTDPSGPYRLPAYMVHAQPFSLQNKSEIYRNLRELYQFGKIIHPDIPLLRKELETLDFERSESSIHLKIHHYKKTMKDDHPDALALACYEAIRMSKSQISIQFIGAPMEEQ